MYTDNTCETATKAKLDVSGAVRDVESGPKALQVAASLLPVREVDQFGARALAVRLAGADRVHVDVCGTDGIAKSERFSDLAKTTVVTLEQVRQIKTAVDRAGLDLPIDVHLVLTEPPKKLLIDYLDAGADSIALHWEAFVDHTRLIQWFKLIRQHGALPVLAVAPDTAIDAVGAFLATTEADVGMVSLSGVSPGRGGRPFQMRVLGLLRQLRRRHGYTGLIQIDGGIEPTCSAPAARDAGADVLVAGTAILGHDGMRNFKDLQEAVKMLRGERMRTAATPLQVRTHQECIECGKTYPASPPIKQSECCSCDLQFQVNLPAELTALTVERPDMWRYGRMLAVPPDSIISAGEGDTPTVFLEDLSQRHGVRIFAKLESRNPTGTFKDREASYVVSRSVLAGLDNIVLQSTGNTGIAVSYYAAMAGISSFFFAPARCQYKLIGPPLAPRNKVILIEGHPIDVKNYATMFAQQHNFPKVSPFHERCEANSTQGYEVGEAILRRQLPQIDFYIQTVAAGMGPIGFYQGMSRVIASAEGTVKMPTIMGIQISEFAPVQEAWEQGLECVGPEGQTPKYGTLHPFEPTLHTTNAPAYYPHLHQAIRATDGLLAVVQPDTVRRYEEELRRSLENHGCTLADTERSAFIGYAGLVEQVRARKIRPGNTVLLVITGKGVHPGFEPIEPDAIIPPDYDASSLLAQLRRGENVC